MIKAVLFDMGGVVSTNVENARYPNLSKLAKLSEKSIKRKMSPIERKFDIGKIQPEKYFRRIAKTLKIEDYTKVERIHCHSIKRSRVRKYMAKIVKELKENGYRVGILSNTNVTDVEVHRKRGDYSLFSPLIFSCEIGYRKPGIKIYRIALKRLGIKAGECIFIDNKRGNLITARLLGMKTILFKSPSQLRKDLERLL